MIFSILVNIECIVDFSESRAGKNQPQKRPRKIQVAAGNLELECENSLFVLFL
jgi:hypothetical protein